MWLDIIRTSLRNLYINLIIAFTMIAYYFTSKLLITSKLTPQLEKGLHWAIIAILIAWILFFLFWLSEVFRELRRSNYWFLLSFIPFLLPLLAYLLHNTAADYALQLLA